MDCLEVRRQLGCEPARVEDALQQHLADCAECAAAADEAQAFERRLDAALAVPLPDGLAARILAAQQAQPVASGGRLRRGAWLSFAAAAALLLAVGIVLQRQRAGATGLPDLVAAHVSGPHEHAALALTTPVAPAEVVQAFADRGVTLAAAPPADVAYVSECPIGRWKSVHMVMPQAGGPVSVVYVVDHRVGAQAAFHRGGLDGREVPLAGGTLVLVARDDARFDAVERDWRNAIEGAPAGAIGEH